MGFEVWQTGRNYPKVKYKPQRPGKSYLFNLLFKKGPLFYFSLNLNIFLFLLFRKFDILWAVDMDTLPACRMAALLKRKPVVFDSHEFFSESPELHHRKLVKRSWILLEQLFIKGCNLRYTVSPGLVKLYKQRYNCDFHLLRNLPFEKKQLKKPATTLANKKILYQGAINVGRGIEETIRAMKWLPDYRFIIIGRGDCTEQLKQLTSDLGLENQIEFTGAVPFEDFPKYHNNILAGMCLLENMGLNYYHSLPNRIFDYMQAGIPVITSHFPDIAEIVKTNNTGLLLDNMEPKQIAMAIREACENKELRQTWEKSIPKAAQKFTWENEEEIIQKIKDFLC